MYPDPRKTNQNKEKVCALVNVLRRFTDAQNSSLIVYRIVIDGGAWGEA